MKLEEYLKKENMTQSRFARQIGYTSSAIAKVVRGEREPGMSLCKAIEDYTGGEVTIEEMLADRRLRTTCPCCGKRIELEKLKEILREKDGIVISMQMIGHNES